MKVLLLALCVVAVLISFGMIFPNLRGQIGIGMGRTPTPVDIQNSVFKGLPRGLQ